MGRWEPDARGRLIGAAIELYSSRGFEQTTVADIAERAGVTERTFFRHFADKREVLFNGSATLLDAVVAAIAAAPVWLAPVEVMGRAMEAGAAQLGVERDYARTRAAVIAANPSLLERELLKLASMGAASTAALRERGVPASAASLAAETGVTVFKLGFDRWTGSTDDPGDLGAPDDLALCIRAALTKLRALTADAGR